MKGIKTFRFDELAPGMGMCIPCRCDVSRLQRSISGIINRVQRRTGKLYRTRQIDGGLLVVRKI